MGIVIKAEKGSILEYTFEITGKTIPIVHNNNKVCYEGKIMNVNNIIYPINTTINSDEFRKNLGEESFDRGDFNIKSKIIYIYGLSGDNAKLKEIEYIKKNNN